MPYRTVDDFWFKVCQLIMQLAISYILLQWFETQFFPYLNNWETSAKNRKGYTDSAKKMMALIMSNETSEGIRIAAYYVRILMCITSYRVYNNFTHIYIYSHCIIYLNFCLLVTSFCEMAKYLLKLLGVKSVLSNRLFCQYQLEQFFGKQRQREVPMTIQTSTNFKIIHLL